MPAFLSQVQSKLRDQAKSLADRMQARQLEDAGDSFKTFVDAMNNAAAAMGPASDKLKSASWQDALAPEQKALQYLLRAESTRRDIEVAFGQQAAVAAAAAVAGTAPRAICRASSTWNWIPRRTSTRIPGRRNPPINGSRPSTKPSRS